MSSTRVVPAPDVEAHIRATLQSFRDDGRSLKELQYTELAELLPGIVARAQRLFPTVTADRVQELIIIAETGSNPFPPAVSANTRGSSQPSQATKAPARFKQAKLDFSGFKPKVNTPSVDVLDEASCLSAPSVFGLPDEEAAQPAAFDAPEGFRVPQAHQQNYGWRLFDNELRLATEYKLAKEDVRPLKEWIPQQGHRQLFDLLKKCIRPEIWEHCVDGDKAFDRDFLLGLPDVPPTSGWYLIVIYDDDDITWWRVYVGQSVDVPRRWSQHEKASTNEAYQALVYEVWRNGESVPEDGTLPRKAKFISLGCDSGAYPDDDKDSQNFRNLGEMFFALLFQALQPSALRRWLPDDVHIQANHRGLNVAVPVINCYSQRAISSIWSNPDPVARAYAMKKAMAALIKGNEVQKAEHYHSQTKARRVLPSATNFQTGIYRNADPTKGDPVVVRVKCETCNTERDDPSPAFVNLTGAYVARPQTCHSCELNEYDLKKGRKTGERVLIPVDPAILFIRSFTLQSQMSRDPSLRAKYEGKEAFEAPVFKLGTSKFKHRAHRVNFKDGVFRDSDPSKGEPETVTVKCKTCGSVMEDEEPFFLTVTGQYVARLLGCENCAKKADGSKKKTIKRTFVPVSATLECVPHSSLDRTLKDPSKRQGLIPKDLVTSGPAEVSDSVGDEDNQPPMKRRKRQA
jgi:hypothetical protein